MIHFLRKFLFPLAALFLLSACGDQSCIEADDWGYPKMSIAAKPDAIRGRDDQQYVDWVDSGRVILDATDQKLVITADPENMWTSWFDGREDYVPKSRICDIANMSSVPEVAKARSDLDAAATTTYCSRSTITQHPSPDRYADCRTPCWIKNGFGLYMLATTSLNPNVDASAVGVTHHIGDTDGDGYLVRDLPHTVDSDIHTGDRLYFRIRDRYYDDNAGDQYIRLKRGTRDPNPGPFETIASFFVGPTMNAAQTMFVNFTRNSDFITIIRATLTLYIIALALAHLIGMDGMKNYADLIMSVLRIGVVIQLISPGAWEFFNTYLFTLFLDGTTSFAASLANPSGEYDPNNPWWSLDQILYKFYSRETHIKIASMLFTNIAGFVYIILIEIALINFVIALVKAFSLLILAYMASAILIALFPIFATFILFKRTRELFSEWIQQMLAFSIQQVIVFATIGIFAAFISSQMERMIGYRVCWKTLFSIFPKDGLDFFDFKFYYPEIREIRQNLEMQNSSGDWVVSSRYIDAPYLDPSSPEDYRRYLDMVNITGAGIIPFVDILSFIATTYVFLKFIAIVPMIADSLKGGGMGKFQSAGLFKPGQGGTGIGITNPLWEAAKDAAFGKKNAKEMDKNKAGFFEKFTASGVGSDKKGRDGGVLGSILRAPFEARDWYTGEQLKGQLKEEREKAREALEERSGAQTMNLANTAAAQDASDPAQTPAQAQKTLSARGKMLQRQADSLVGSTVGMNAQHADAPGLLKELMKLRIPFTQEGMDLGEIDDAIRRLGGK